MILTTSWRYLLKIVGKAKKGPQPPIYYWPASLLQPASTTVWSTWDRQTAAIWSAIVSWLSIRTPRFLTAVENCSTVPFRNVNVVAESYSADAVCQVKWSASCLRLASDDYWPSNRERVQGSQRSVQLLPGTRPLVHWYTVVYRLHTRDCIRVVCPPPGCRVTDRRTDRRVASLARALMNLSSTTSHHRRSTLTVPSITHSHRYTVLDAHDINKICIRGNEKICSAPPLNPLTDRQQNLHRRLGLMLMTCRKSAPQIPKAHSWKTK